MKGRVLLLEDEFDTRDLLGRALGRVGYHVVSAANGEEALALAAKAEALTVVVADVVIGADDRRGLRFIPELRALGVTAPVVIITAYADLDKVKTALNEGAAHL